MNRIADIKKQYNCHIFILRGINISQLSFSSINLYVQAAGNKLSVQYLGRIFVCHQCRSNRHIAGYATIVTVLMTDKKTSKNG
jgi:hypothetical protein